MKTTLVCAAVALLFAGSALAQDSHYVNGYTRSDGTYVQGRYQTNPNGTRNDNWSTQGNVNPYTGQEGTKPRDGYEPRGQSSYGHGAQPGERGESSYGRAPPPDPYVPSNPY